MPPNEAGALARPDLGDKSCSVRAIIGTSPVIQLEDTSSYAALEQHVYEAFRPQDVIEEVWAADYLALQWEILSLRRVKADFVRSSMRAGLEKLIGPFVPWKERDALLDGWVKHDPLARAQVERHLEAAGLSQNAIIAQTVGGYLRELEMIETAIARAEIRRNVALGEFERHREVVPGRAQQPSHQIEHAGSKSSRAEEQP